MCIPGFALRVVAVGLAPGDRREGRPSLRTHDGWRILEQGEVIAFPVGETGAHELVNHTETSVRFLAFSNQQPDIAVFPDSGKIGAFERRPEGGGLHRVFREADAVGYWDAEDPPAVRPARGRA